MYLQGNLQLVFDALYELGVIEPVLNMNWQDALKELDRDPRSLLEVVSVANTHQDNTKNLINKLEKFSEKSLSFLAMEVAREFADFHSREEVH